MEKEQLDQLVQHLKKTQKKLRPFFSKQETNCYRVYSGSINDTAYRMDLYGEFLHISQFSQTGEDGEDLSAEELERVAGALYIKPENIIVKTRKKLQEHKQYTPLDDRKDKMEVRENGLSFLVNLRDYIDTGLFLDHRKTRQLVRQECFGKKVLNLFAYTGSFSVYAASGGAGGVTTVDLSGPYLQWAEENFRANDFLPGMFEFVQADVIPYLRESRRKNRKWDLIILDPPTFSNSRKMDKVWDVQKNHEEIIELCAPLLNNDGVILFSTNYRQFHLNRKALSGFMIEDISSQTKDEDFTGKNEHRCWRLVPQKSGQSKSSGRSQPGGRKNDSSRKRAPSRGSQRKIRG